MAEQTPREKMTAQIVTKAQEDPAFKKQLLSDPRAALEQELDMALPENMAVEVLEETPDKVYLVLPVDTEDLEIPDELVEKVSAGFMAEDGCI